MDTLERAKEDLKQGWKTPSGAICRCCGQLVKLYRRRIYSTPARELIALYWLSQNNEDYHHISNFRHLHGGDISKLRYWGLVEERKNEDNQKRTSGYWRITDKGRDYVETKITVPKYAYIYNKQAYEFGGDDQTIIDALGKNFSYPELMGYLL